MLLESKKRITVYFICDILSIFLSWMGAVLIRIYCIGETESTLFMDFLKLSPLAIGVELLALASGGLYNQTIIKKWHRDISLVTQANTASWLLLIAILYFLFPNRITRLGLGIFYLVSLVVIVLERFILNNIYYILNKKNRKHLNVLLVGHSIQTEEYIKLNQSSDDSFYNFIGWIDGPQKNSFNIPHSKLEIKDYIKKNKIDLIVLGYSQKDYIKMENTLSQCYDILIPIVIIPNISYLYLHSHMEDFRGLPTIYLNHFRHNLIDRSIKRGIDIFGALVAIALFFPFFILVPILIKLTSKGPVFYKQIRMTRDGKKFNMWKFRSMKINAEDNSGAVWAKKIDGRKTPIGGFLRATSLDEIPQFWNVLKGEMSLVGPRPERPELIEKFKLDIPGYMLRHKMKTGITGWAQISGFRGDTSLEKRIEYDLFYIKNWSLGLDIKIILLTFFKGFVNKNAY